MKVHTVGFRAATDILLQGVSQAELARELGVSIASIRQARLGENAKAHRPPPPDWQQGVIKLAARQVRRLQRLIADLGADRQAELFEPRRPGSRVSRSRGQGQTRST